MRRMPRWLVTTAAGVALLAACGDTGDDGGAGAAAAPPSAGGAAGPGTGGAEGAGGAEGTVDEVTPPGTRLGLGEMANLPFEGDALLGITVDDITAGTADERAAFPQQDRPGDLYYVTITIRNTGSPEDLTSYLPAADALFAVQEDGARATPVGGSAAAGPCEGRDPTGLPVGESFTTCLAYLAPGGVAVDAVAYAFGFEAEPVVWR